MYQHTEAAAATTAVCFDPTAMPEGAVAGSGAGDNHGFSHSSFTSAPSSLIMMDEATRQLQPPNPEGGEAAPVEFINAQQLQSHLAFTNMEQIFPNDNDNRLMGEGTDWGTNETTNFNHNQFQHDQLQQQEQPLDLHQNFNIRGAAGPSNDFLNLLLLPRCSSLLPNHSISFTNPPQKTGGDFSSSLGFLGVEIPTADNISEPLFHLNLPPAQPPLFQDLMFQSFSGVHGYNLPRSSSSLFGGSIGMDEGEGSGGLCQDIPLGDNGVFEFGRDDMAACLGKGKESKCPKNFVTERQRRVNLNDKYKHLRSLVPNPTKTDRASIVGDAIEYIKELNRTVNELKLLVEKKRFTKERTKRQKVDDDGAAGGGDVESGPNVVKTEQVDPSFNGTLRSSWLQRKCKDTEVDVRIIDDEVTIKLVQRKKINCLLYVSRILDELQLDLRHVAGGHVGDYYSFLFNTKIYEGSSVYASAIANKLIEVVDRQYAAISPANSYQL
ncbi:hypothetical protein Ancab_037575 [Ancistrocladus abbreviatus]